MFLDGGNSIGDRHDLYFDFNLEIAYCVNVFHSWNHFLRAPSIKKSDVLLFEICHRKK